MRQRETEKEEEKRKLDSKTQEKLHNDCMINNFLITKLIEKTIFCTENSLNYYFSNSKVCRQGLRNLGKLESKTKK